MKRNIIAGKEFCTYVKTPLVADDVHAYNVVWETGVTQENAGMIITAKRSDGVTVTDYVATDEYGKGEYTLAGNMYSVTGTLELRLSLVWETTTLTEKVLIFEVIEGCGNEKIESEDNVPILNTILAKANEAIDVVSSMPKKLSQFENDVSFIIDSNYVHTDNNFTNAHKNAISAATTQISTLEEEIDSVSMQISSLEEDAASASTQISSLEEDVASVSTQISSLEEELEETTSIAKGATKAVSFTSYSALVNHFNSVNTNDNYTVGQSVMIVTVNVPDLWISEKADEFIKYTYTTNDNFIKELNDNKTVQIGFYKFSQLETQKINLDEYVNKNNSTYKEILNWKRYSPFSYSVLFDNYEHMFQYFKICDEGDSNFYAPDRSGDIAYETLLRTGQYIAIADKNLPDLIVTRDEPNLNKYVEWEFKSNEDFMNEIKTNGIFLAGFYGFSFAGLKNLDGYATKEDVDNALKSAILDSWEAEV